MTEAQLEGAASRAHAMRVRAVQRLGEGPLPELGAALAGLVRVEAALVANLRGMRQAAEREALARRSRGLPGLGPSGEGYRAARQLLAAVTNARDELSTQG
ncbi:hypothetical protein [Microlunatus antarcticus]|uniref:Uncharacterized protein n=1 Tax=Microlunatus antarcticus TaxID=53388 RepID=A0A7W5JWB9_9ACTN|nr:hypothetical protein [Microlunatus antarcticus]MBB3327468.1 hypothetical protein [Microlunatus antarcticus]